MDACTFSGNCDGCPGRVLCHCLQVTEDVVAEAISVFSLTTVKEVRQHTGAGDGCTACHRRVRQLLQQSRQVEPAIQSPSSSPSPI